MDFLNRSFPDLTALAILKPKEVSDAIFFDVLLDINTSSNESGAYQYSSSLFEDTHSISYRVLSWILYISSRCSQIKMKDILKTLPEVQRNSIGSSGTFEKKTRFYNDTSTKNVKQIQ